MDIWLVKQESNVDGERIFSVTPCSSLEIAKEVMQKAIDIILSDGFFKGYKDGEDWASVERRENEFFISASYDSYDELIEIEKRKLL